MLNMAVQRLHLAFCSVEDILHSGTLSPVPAALARRRGLPSTSTQPTLQWWTVAWATLMGTC